MTTSTKSYKKSEGLAIPVGVVVPYAGQADIAGWLICDGRLVNIVDYPELYAAIGSFFPAGATQFYLPDLRGRIVAGHTKIGGTYAARLTTLPNGGCAIGCAGGADRHALTIQQLAAHAHTLASCSEAHDHANVYLPDASPDHYHYSDYDDFAQLSGTSNKCRLDGSGSTYNTTVQLADHAHATSITTCSFNHAHALTLQGSGSYHANVQPTLILNYLIHAGA